MSSLPLRFAAALVFVASSASAQQLSIASGQKIAFLGDSITQAGARAPAGYCRLVVRGLALLGTKVELIPAGSTVVVLDDAAANGLQDLDRRSL